jgi:tetratricopeptide (TPR) repeat protein
MRQEAATCAYGADMNESNRLKGYRNVKMTISWMVAVCFAITGCATTEQAPPVVQVAIVDSVGFTITEGKPVDEESRLRYDDAQRRLNQGSLQEGVAGLHAVAATAPDLVAPQIDLGIAYHQSGDLEAAETHLNKALELHPDHPVAHNELGIIYRKTGRFDEARKSYQAALAIYPGYHHARRNLAILCDLYLGDLKCALENYEAYMSTVPGDDEAEIWIADLRYRMGQ